MEYQTGRHQHRHDYKHVERRRLAWSMGITLVVMFVEIAGGIVANSIALLSDAGHMFTHFFALLLSYGAIRLASAPPTDTRTYGNYRMEVLAAFANGIFLLVVTVLIVRESILRLLEPEPVATAEMFYIAIAGLAVNIATVLIIGESHKGDRNIRAAFVHMLADAFSSVAVVAGAVVMHVTGWVQLDPILGLFISLLIFVWAFGVIKDAARVLLEYTPRDIAAPAVRQAILQVDDRIAGVEDLHITEITSHMYDLSAIVKTRTDSIAEANVVIDRINRILSSRFHIHHTTIQPVPSDKRQYGAGERYHF